MDINDAWKKVIELAEAGAKTDADRAAVGSMRAFRPGDYQELLRLTTVHAAYYNAGHPGADNEVVSDLHAQTARMGVDFDHLAERVVDVVEGFCDKPRSHVHPREQIKGLGFDVLAVIAERLDAAAEEAMPESGKMGPEYFSALPWDRVSADHWYLPLTDEAVPLEVHITREASGSGETWFWIQTKRQGMPEGPMQNPEPFDDLAQAKQAGSRIFDDFAKSADANGYRP